MYFREIETDPKALREHVETQRQMASRRMADVAAKKTRKRLDRKR